MSNNTTLIDQIAEQLGIDRRIAEEALTALTEQIRALTQESDSVSIPGLGTFSRSSDALSFDPERALAMTVNRRFAELEDLEVQSPLESGPSDSPAAADSTELSGATGWHELADEVVPEEQEDDSVVEWSHLGIDDSHVAEDDLFEEAEADIFGHEDAGDAGIFDPVAEIEGDLWPDEASTDVEPESIEAAAVSEASEPEMDGDPERDIERLYPRRKKSSSALAWVAVAVLGLIVAASFAFVSMKRTGSLPFGLGAADGDEVASETGARDPGAVVADPIDVVPQDGTEPPTRDETATAADPMGAEVVQDATESVVDEAAPPAGVWSGPGGFDLSVGGYTIIVGSKPGETSAREEAAALAALFPDLDQPVDLFRAEVNNEQWYRVGLGQYPSESAARRDLSRLSSRLPAGSWVLRIE